MSISQRPTATSTPASSAPSTPCDHPRALNTPAVTRAPTSAATSFGFSPVAAPTAPPASPFPPACFTQCGSRSPSRHPKGFWMWCRMPCGRPGALAATPLRLHHCSPATVRPAPYIARRLPAGRPPGGPRCCPPMGRSSPNMRRRIGRRRTTCSSPTGAASAAPSVSVCLVTRPHARRMRGPSGVAHGLYFATPLCPINMCLSSAAEPARGSRGPLLIDFVTS